MTSQFQTWLRVGDAPFDGDLELAVIDEDGEHALIFACRRIADGWVRSDTGVRLSVEPTHWRPWAREGYALGIHLERTASSLRSINCPDRFATTLLKPLASGVQVVALTDTSSTRPPARGESQGAGRRARGGLPNAAMSAANETAHLCR